MSTTGNPNAVPTADHADLRAQLSTLTLIDEHRLRRRLGRAHSPAALAHAAREVDTARERIAARRARVPGVSFPAALPVSARRDDIAAAIAAHQVVIVAGETGSGKTTQIPKICLESGRGIRGTIGHTQPRRLAARTVAERIAEELGTELGDLVGYAVRFTDRSSAESLVRVMTDGILLAEIQHDRLLRRYDTIIIDEAHERSLTIDFLLGYLKQLCPQREDLKVIITSATIDPELFARHFAVDGIPAPIIEVSGRSFPVELRYRPTTVERDDELIDRDPVEATCDAVAELLDDSRSGDVLVFASGEREIRDTADALADRRLRDVEVLPLYARLSAAEQHRVFEPHQRRRVVLATNVAETSLTVPGIHYVVDPGTARISRYSMRTKVQRLPIEPISQASARQRAGRCGRIADGICIRLYSEADFQQRPAFTEPEIRRTNLAAVLLRMTALGLDDIEHFPFVQAPEARAVRDGMALLTELGALERHDGRPRLTEVGRQMAELPVDPRLARMVVAGRNDGCLPEVLIIVSALSIQDVRERPADNQAAADAIHARFVVPNSDFMAYLSLWDYLTEQQRTQSSSQFRRRCRTEFLHWLRIREWQDLHAQLRSIVTGLGWTCDTDGAWTRKRNAIHRSLLSGMLSHIGVREGETREYLGARGAKFALFPGSSLSSKPPRWVMAAELVETSRLWGRMAAAIEPEWAEKAAGDVVKRSYSEPHWSARRGACVAYERVTLYGIPLVSRRLVDFGRIDGPLARELFLRHALVQGEWRTDHEFFRRNRELLADVAEWEHRVRRRDILVDDQELFDFYDRRVPPDIVSVRHFDSWWHRARRSNPTLLDFTTDAVTVSATAMDDHGTFPDVWRHGDLELPLTYHFEPGHEDDGVGVRIPVTVLPRVRAVGFDWLVPGMRTELATALIKTLPKTLRRAVVPAADFAAAALSALRPGSEPLRAGLARELTTLAGIPIRPDDFDVAALPDHLRMTFVAVEADGTVLDRDKGLPALRARLAPNVAATLSEVAGRDERPPASVWTAETLGTIPDTVRHTTGGHTVVGYPTLMVEPTGVAVRVVADAGEQAAAMRAGTTALLLTTLVPPSKTAVGRLSADQRMALSQSPYPNLDALLEDCRRCAVDELVGEFAHPVRDPDSFAHLADRVGPAVGDRVRSLVALVVDVVGDAVALRLALSDCTVAPAAEDVRRQLDSLVFDGFVGHFGRDRVRELPRYLRAAAIRLRALPGSAARDRVASETLDRIEASYRNHRARASSEQRRVAEIDAVFWMIQELRVSLFAQRLGTAHPVSEKRIAKALAEL